MLDLARIRAWFRAVFFWLSPDKKSGNEQGPETDRDHALVLSVTKPTAIPTWRQFRYLGRVMKVNEIKLLITIITVGTIALLAGIILIAKDHLTIIPIVGGTYTEAVIGEPHAINPVDAPANETDADIVALIYSGLFKMNGLEPIPDLASSYEWSEDKKTLTVKLREDALFQNGERVTADDVQFTFESIQDPARASILAPLFRGVQISAKDVHVVKFILDQPDVSFLKSLTVGIMPAALWQNIPPANARLANINLKPIGSGPYQVKSFTRDQRGVIRSYTLERSEFYYGIKPFIQTLTFQIYPDISPAEDALKSDLVDGLSFLTPIEMDKFTAVTRWNTATLNAPQQTIAFFNLKDETLKDIKIREALTKAVNKNEIVDSLGGHAEITDAAYPFLTPTTSTKTDIEGAREILDKAGWILQENQTVRVKKGTENSATTTQLTINILVPDQPDLIKVAENLKRQWSLVGVQVEIQAEDMPTVMRRSSRDRDTQVVLWNVLYSRDQDLSPIWWSGQTSERGTNFSGLADKDIDELINKTKAATSTETLLQAQTTLSDKLIEKYPAIFLARPEYGYIVSTRVKGVPENLLILKPSDRFQQINEWYIKTGWRWK
ncbi:MAG: ABC transporter substrate-binding protein [Patescibacteria group bacterium]|nr:ABC transporter substrate-binding protein [Patescibacteria group bacterium]